MIIDSFDNISNYEGMHPNLNYAISFLKKLDISSLEKGKIEILNDDIFLNIFNLQLSPSVSNVFEYHKKYIDIHFMISGEEIVKLGVMEDQETDHYERDSDNGSIVCKDSQSFKLMRKWFVIYFPGEPHQPDNYLNMNNKVVKGVMKVLY